MKRWLIRFRLDGDHPQGGLVTGEVDIGPLALSQMVLERVRHRRSQRQRQRPCQLHMTTARHVLE